MNYNSRYQASNGSWPKWQSTEINPTAPPTESPDLAGGAEKALLEAVVAMQAIMLLAWLILLLVARTRIRERSLDFGVELLPAERYGCLGGSCCTRLRGAEATV